MRAACVREQVLRACGEFAEAVSVFRGVCCEIATGAKRPRNDKSEAIAVLTVVCTNRQHIAGSHAKSVPRGRGTQILFRFSA